MGLDDINNGIFYINCSNSFELSVVNRYDCVKFMIFIFLSVSSKIHFNYCTERFQYFLFVIK